MIGRQALASLAVFLLLLINQSVEGYAVVPERPIPLPPRRNIKWACPPGNMIPPDPLDVYRIHFEKVQEFCQQNGDQCYNEIGELMNQIGSRLLTKYWKQMEAEMCKNETNYFNPFL